MKSIKAWAVVNTKGELMNAASGRMLICRRRNQMNWSPADGEYAVRVEIKELVSKKKRIS